METDIRHRVQGTKQTGKKMIMAVYQERKELLSEKPEVGNGMVNILPEAKPGIAGPNVKYNGERMPADIYGGGHIIVDSSSKDVVTPKVSSLTNNVPPPYKKSNGKVKDRKHVTQLGSLEHDFHSNDRANAGNILKVTRIGSDNYEHERHFTEHARANSHDHLEKVHIKLDGLPINSIPRPGSVGSIHLKSQSSGTVIYIRFNFINSLYIICNKF